MLNLDLSLKNSNNIFFSFFILNSKTSSNWDNVRGLCFSNKYINIYGYNTNFILGKYWLLH